MPFTGNVVSTDFVFLVVSVANAIICAQGQSRGGGCGTRGGNYPTWLHQKFHIHILPNIKNKILHSPHLEQWQKKQNTLDLGTVKLGIKKRRKKKSYYVVFTLQNLYHTNLVQCFFCLIPNLPLLSLSLITLFLVNHLTFLVIFNHKA